MKSTVAQAIGVAMLLVVGSLANPLFADSGSYPGCAGEACDAVGRGLLGFIDRNSPGLHGNGRSCADCHSPLENFQLSPNGVQFRWNLLQLARRYNPKADDPLFRPIDADDFRVNGQAASDFTTLRGNALVRITLQLPANLKLVDPASIDPQTGLPLPGGPQYLIDPSTGLSYSYVDVARMVPSVNNVALTGPDNGAIVWPRGPNPAGGYQLDARAGTLPDLYIVLLFKGYDKFKWRCESCCDCSHAMCLEEV